MQKTGYLELFIGPMYSGKSSTLAMKAVRHADVGLSVLYVNHSLDNRSTKGDMTFSTHNSQYSKMSPKVKTVKVGLLADVNIENYHVIAVDECQFFDDLVSIVQKWVTDDHKIVYCAGLDGDCFRQSFGHTVELIPFADNIIRLQADCRLCAQNFLQLPQSEQVHTIIMKAPFTARMSNSKELILPGADDLYIPLCRYHYDTFMSDKPS